MADTAAIAFTLNGAPVAGELPSIDVAHVSTPERSTDLGAKGAGEVGTVAAAAASRLAVNDALRPFGIVVCDQPFNPERVMVAIGGGFRSMLHG